jgi:pyruvate dehydrogenase E1 component alpha subunit
MGQGLVYETMNMASLWKLPVIFICEKNHYVEYTKYEEVTSGELSARPAAFGIPVEELDGQDIRQVYAAAQRAVARARQGQGPSFIICDTYRYYGHHVGDINRGYYRSKEEEEQWKTERDPIQKAKEWLTGEMQAPVSVLDEIEQRVAEEIRLGVDFALNAPYPNPSEVTKNVYA